MATTSMMGRLAVIGAAAVMSVSGSRTIARAQAIRPRFVPLAPLNVAVGPSFYRQPMALADVNGDQRPDLVAIEPDDLRVGVFVNVGDGGFDLVATPELVEDVTPSAVAVADVGSPFASSGAGRPDGRPDIVVGGDDGEVEVLFGRGDGQFERPEGAIEPDATDEVIGLVIADFDPGNGLDVVLLDESGLVLLCNDGRGVFRECSGDEAIPAGDGPVDIVGGDFNGDGRADVAVLDGDSQRVWPFLGTGDATFFAPGASVDVAGDANGDVAVDLDVGRLDGDPRDDLVVANASAFGALPGVALFGAADGSFRTSAFVLDFEAAAIAIGNVNPAGAGANDVISGYDGLSSYALVLNLGDGQGVLSDPFVPAGSTTIDSAALVLAGDLDGDAIADLVVLDGDGEEARVLLSDPAGVPSCTGDCNGNGTVSIDELLRGANILLGQAALSTCLALDVDGNSRVTVDELVVAVARDMGGCPS